MGTLSITLVGVLGAVGALGLFTGRPSWVQTLGFAAGVYWLVSVVICLAVIAGWGGTDRGDKLMRSGFIAAVLALVVTGVALYSAVLSGKSSEHTDVRMVLTPAARDDIEALCTARLPEMPWATLDPDDLNDRFVKVQLDVKDGSGKPTCPTSVVVGTAGIRLVQDSPSP